jgi:hypothetical protein
MDIQLAHLVVNALVEVLDEDIPLTSLPERRVPLGPHDAAGLVLDERVVEMLKRALSVGGANVVDVGVSERTTGDGVTTDTDATGSAGSVFEDHTKTHEATGPIMLKISKSMASVTEGSSSPT